MPPKLQLRAGDILLYHSKPLSFKHLGSWFFGQVIKFHTAHPIAHVEIYDGSYLSLASRDGQGVGRYSLYIEGLAYVLRPAVPLDLAKGHQWFDSMRGVPYGWLDLLNFVGVSVDVRGIVCSPFVAGYLRACGWAVFPADPVNRVAPFQFLDLVGPECSVAYKF